MVFYASTAGRYSIFDFLEQVRVRGMICRSLRLALVAGLGFALSMPALAMAVGNSGARGDGPSSLGWSGPRMDTQTAMTVETRDQHGRTQATVAVTVIGEDGRPATGAVAISDRGAQLAGAALNAQGRASVVVALAAGPHSLLAIYKGDATHLGSVSQSAGAQAQTSSTPNFLVSVAPATLSLTPGQSGTVIASVTPQNSASLTAPMFVTLSCSGLPDQAACTFTPENVEILPNATAAIASSVVVGTQLGSQGQASLAPHPRSNPVAWAFLLPGALSLGGLAWSARRRAWLRRLSLLALLGLVTVLGATACAPRYDYYNHGPPANPATPAGTYTVYVTAQSSNGVTAITNSTTIALTVQ
jgi:hypothetical protein